MFTSKERILSTFPDTSGGSANLKMPKKNFVVGLSEASISEYK